MIVYRFRPIVTKENDTYDGIYGVEYDEMVKANEGVVSSFANNFIKTANINGIKRFEKIYGIRENPTLSLEERRRMVYERMTYKPPFTRQRLAMLLENLFGKGNYSFELDAQNFTLVVAISQLDKNLYDSYMDRIRQIIPSNIYLIPSTPYTYLYLSGMRYGSDRTYTNVGAGNGEYNLVGLTNYVYVGQGNGSYSISNETDSSNPNKLCHYTYRELSLYSVVDTTLELFAPGNNIGEIVPLAGTGIAFTSDM